LNKVIVIESVRVEMRPVVVGLPPSMYVEYLGETADGLMFVIFRPKEDWSYEDFILLMQAPGETMRRVAIDKVVRYRDGGTTDIATKAGDFHFPTPFNPKAEPTFCGRPVSFCEREPQ
jgi:hypothetical protein